jgi:very-short-patch-repair endonuclease
VKLAANVSSFIERASELRGRAEAQRFNYDLRANCEDLGMESPIEHLFWIALVAICEANFIVINPGPELGRNDEMVMGRGVYVKPQAAIGKYRVDFLLSQHGIAPEDVHGPVIVELDGHDFHDKDKAQRSYEKARDRFLTRERYRVVHFTGSDVVKDPFATAHEVLEMLAVFVGTGIEKYDRHNPLSVEAL